MNNFCENTTSTELISIAPPLCDLVSQDLSSNKEEDLTNPSTDQAKNLDQVIPRYNTRSASGRKPRKRKTSTEGSKTFEFGDHPEALHTRNLRSSGRRNVRYNTRSAMGRKQFTRKMSSAKPSTYEQGRRISLTKVKQYFHQLSPQDQRRFMEEMASEISIGGVTPSVSAAIDKGLEIHNIKKCIIQIDPVHGEYFQNDGDM